MKHAIQGGATKSKGSANRWGHWRLNVTVASASLVIASARSKKTAQLNMKPGVKVGQPSIV